VRLRVPGALRLDAGAFFNIVRGGCMLLATGSWAIPRIT
jgi:hypothetical protein